MENSSENPIDYSTHEMRIFNDLVEKLKNETKEQLLQYKEVLAAKLEKTLEAIKAKRVEIKEAAPTSDMLVLDLELKQKLMVFKDEERQMDALNTVISTK